MLLSGADKGGLFTSVSLQESSNILLQVSVSENIHLPGIGLLDRIGPVHCLLPGIILSSFSLPCHATNLFSHTFALSGYTHTSVVVFEVVVTVSALPERCFLSTFQSIPQYLHVCCWNSRVTLIFKFYCIIITTTIRTRIH